MWCGISEGIRAGIYAGGVPVLDHSGHPAVAAVRLPAAENIAPMTELTLDYGSAAASHFPGGCKCGAAECISLQQQQPQQQQKQQQKQQQQPVAAVEKAAGGSAAEATGGGAVEEEEVAEEEEEESDEELGV